MYNANNKATVGDQRLLVVSARERTEDHIMKAGTNPGNFWGDADFQIHVAQDIQTQKNRARRTAGITLLRVTKEI